MSVFHLPAGRAAYDGDPVLITAESAGWTYSGLRVLRIPAGESRVLTTGETELIVLPMAGSLSVEIEGKQFDLAGRDTVFTGVTDFAYAPIDAEVRLTSSYGAEVAMPSARANRRLEPAYGPASGVPVEIRGAGQASRQCNNFCDPDTFAADKLIAVEVLTPAGNWSSYPPHKHDEVSDHECVNEEIYYFRMSGRTGTPAERAYDAEGFGLHRTYTPDGVVDDTMTVRDGDVYLIPRGYHGPCVAPPGYTMYYLNVMAGPAPKRQMLFCDDPAHHWVRETWQAEQPDPRLPMYTSEEQP